MHCAKFLAVLIFFCPSTWPQASSLTSRTKNPGLGVEILSSTNPSHKKFSECEPAKTALVDAMKFVHLSDLLIVAYKNPRKATWKILSS